MPQFRNKALDYTAAFDKNPNPDQWELVDETPKEVTEAPEPADVPTAPDTEES